MRNRFLAAIGGLAVISLAAISGAAQQAPSAKTWTPLRTSWGEPDLQGVWANNNATPLERPKELQGRQFLTEEEVASLKKVAGQIFDGNGDAAFADAVFLAALRNVQGNAKGYESSDGRTGNYNSFWLVDRDFDNRTSLVTDPPDGRVPPLTPEAQQRAADAAAVRTRLPAGPEDLTLSLRCISPGVPNVFAGYNSYYRILQIPGYVVIGTEMYHDARIVPLDGRPHLSPNVRLRNGDSRGHWEGNTLVVDTTNFLSQGGSGQSSFQIAAGQNLHLIERFTRVGPNAVNYEFTIDDSTTWTKPWTGMIPLKQSQDKLYEFACHEGNRGLVGTLSGARFQEKAAAEAAKKGSR